MLFTCEISVFCYFFSKKSVSYARILHTYVLFLWLCKDEEQKKATVKDDGNLMFSQRNNPYCELLQFCSANVDNIS